mgnify:CR=1 FL=1
MDKDNSINNYNHSISLLERKNLVITGVKKIENFDNNQFILETIMGFMIVKGEGLELVKLDTLQGHVTIKGFLCSINYVEDNLKKDKAVCIFPEGQIEKAVGTDAAGHELPHQAGLCQLHDPGDGREQETSDCPLQPMGAGCPGRIT